MIQGFLKLFLVDTAPHRLRLTLEKKGRGGGTFTCAQFPSVSAKIPSEKGNAIVKGLGKKLINVNDRTLSLGWRKLQRGALTAWWPDPPRDRYGEESTRSDN